MAKMNAVNYKELNKNQSLGQFLPVIEEKQPN